MNESGWIGLVVAAIVFVILGSGALDQLILTLLGIASLVFIVGAVLYFVADWTLGDRR